MGNTAVLDPMESAVQDAETAAQYFGRIDVDAQYVVLKKGQPKAAWFEGMDTDGRTTEVIIRLNPHDVTGLTKLVERKIISNSGEWSDKVWPSLRDLGIKSLREINGKWAHIELVPSGRTWKNREGEEVKGTTFKFVKLFDLESDLVKQWEEVTGGSGNQAHTPAAHNAPATVSQNDHEKAVAAQFLPALVKGANGDLVNLANILASMTPVNKYFTVDSPEVQALLKAA